MQSSTVDYPLKTISVIGLGKLGLPIAACYAHKSYQVIGVDVNSQIVQCLNQGRTPIFEPGLEEMLHTSRTRLSATDNCRQAVLDTDVTFIVVPTPSEEGGGFSLRFVLDACKQIGLALRDKRAHLVVLTSTVMPGATDGAVRAALEHTSGKRCGRDFGLCYSPEFIALGSVIHDLLYPDFLLIGESDPQAGEALASFYRSVCQNQPPLARMNNVNAEIAKLAVNTFVTAKIAFANTLARVCEQIPGAHVDTVTEALGLDSRIGRKYLKGALAYGGPCFPRDNAALSALARQVGVPALLAEGTDAANRQDRTLLAGRVRDALPPNGTVGILGLAYKPNTDVVQESPGLWLAQTLAEARVRVVVYDPAAMLNAQAVLGERVQYVSSAAECIQHSDVVVLATPWKEFQTLPAAVWERPDTPCAIIDCWRILEPARYGDKIHYVPLGVGPPLEATQHQAQTQQEQKL